MYSELINVPFLIFDYTRDKGEVCDTLVSNIDIPPTIVHLFGLEPEENFKGHSVLALKDYPERGCFGEAIDKGSAHEKETDRPIYYYQNKELKIIYRESMDSWEMYDLKKDPQELNNMVETSLRAEEMKKALKPRIRKMVKG